MTPREAVLRELRKLGRELEEAMTLVYAMYHNLTAKKKKVKKRK
jgi:hypothetical protein